MGTQRIVITGLGVVSPLGTGKEAFWNSLMAGRDAIGPITLFDTAGQRVGRGGQVRDFNRDAHDFHGAPADCGRASQFAIVAGREALGDAGIAADAMDRTRIGLSLGSTMGEGRVVEHINDLRLTGSHGDVTPGMSKAARPDAIIRTVASVLDLRGPANLFSTACAAGNYALAHASQLLVNGQVDVMCAGGTDPLSRIALTGFNSMFAVAPDCCRPFDRNRKGMCPSEGAAVLVLERQSDAEARGVRIYGELAGYGLCNEAFHATALDPSGRGGVRVMEQALERAGLHPEDVDYVSAHGTGTPTNDRVETVAIKKAFGKAAFTVPVSSIKSMLGHAMSAASAYEAIVCALAMERGRVPPTINYADADPECDLDYVPNQPRDMTVRVAMSNAFALGGHCSSVVFRSM